MTAVNVLAYHRYIIVLIMAVADQQSLHGGTVRVKKTIRT